MNATGPHWWQVNIGSGNGLVPSGDKPMLTYRSMSPYDVTWPQWVNLDTVLVHGGMLFLSGQVLAQHGNIDFIMIQYCCIMAMLVWFWYSIGTLWQLCSHSLYWLVKRHCFDSGQLLAYHGNIGLILDLQVYWIVHVSLIVVQVCYVITILIWFWSSIVILWDCLFGSC